jgi:hypothetical protein
VIGVCNAADSLDKEGLYAALASIYAELDSKDLTFVYNTTGLEVMPVRETPTSLNTLFTDAPPTMPRQMPLPGDSVLPAGATSVSVEPPLKVEEQAALDEIHQRLLEGAKIVFIVTPAVPGAQPDVMILDGASPNFVGQLNNMARASNTTPTALEIPLREEPVIKWTGETGSWHVSENVPIRR